MHKASRPKPSRMQPLIKRTYINTRTGAGQPLRRIRSAREKFCWIGIREIVGPRVVHNFAATQASARAAFGHHDRSHREGAAPRHKPIRDAHALHFDIALLAHDKEQSVADKVFLEAADHIF